MKKHYKFIIAIIFGIIVTLFLLPNTNTKYVLQESIDLVLVPDDNNILINEDIFYIDDYKSDYMELTISNNNDYDITGNVTFQNLVLLEEFTVSANEQNKTLYIYLTNEIESSDNTCYVDININTPYKRIYSDKIGFIKPIHFLNKSTTNRQTDMFRKYI